ncbi:MAG: hypothetical protein Q8J96_00735, partial [Rhodocyclaceae bacterium]|nr:hypothetical protein [Rhodocyclaceae bacterium]
PASALSGGNNRATVLFLNASPYRAIVRPYRPQVQDHIGATTILTRGDSLRSRRLLPVSRIAAGTPPLSKTSVHSTESTEDTEQRRKHTKVRRTQRATCSYFVTPGFFSVITASFVVNRFSRVEARR